MRLVVIIGCIICLAAIALSQEVIIRDFPVGVAGSFDTEKLKAYYPELKKIADTLSAYPRARAIITGGADGVKYRHDNDAKNPGLAAVFSFFWTGLGQIYNGQIGKGILFIVAFAVSVVLMFVLIGFITSPILWIWGMYDAYTSAQKINNDMARRADSGPDRVIS